MAQIPPFYLDCVVAIGSRLPNDSIQWIGTGFIYGKRIIIDGQNEAVYALFLITNRHVIKPNESGVLILRVSPDTGTVAKDFPVDFTTSDKNIWLTYHPDPEIDIAVVALNYDALQKNGAKMTAFCDDQHVLFDQQLKEHEFSEGEGLFVLGFPMNMVEIKEKAPICRSGVVARIRDYMDGRSKIILADTFVYPGNSGGPVITKVDATAISGTKNLGKAQLLGIIASYIPYREEAISRQTGRTRIIFEDNTGLSVVFPAKYIRETVDLCFSKMTPGKFTPKSSS